MEIESTVTINQDEKRAIQYELYSDGKFLPDSATIEVFDENYNSIMGPQSCLITDNKISSIIDQTVTKNSGLYAIYWKIDKENQTFNKVTTLKVKEIPW